MIKAAPLWTRRRAPMCYLMSPCRLVQKRRGYVVRKAAWYVGLKAAFMHVLFLPKSDGC